MNGSFLLDTNIVIPFFDGNQDIVEKIDQAYEIFIPAIVIGELYYGAFKSSKQLKNIERIDNFKPHVSILDCDEFTAKIYGQFKHELKSKGKPIPENDIWIAALAKQYDITLVTRDKHFENLDNLIFELW